MAAMNNTTKQLYMNHTTKQPLNNLFSGWAAGFFLTKDAVFFKQRSLLPCAYSESL